MQPLPQEDLDILGLEPPVTQATVGQAYRRLVITSHPDLGGDGDTMARINRARDRLLASLDQPAPTPPVSVATAAPVVTLVADEHVDDPPPYLYLLWMVLLPVAVFTLLVTVLSLVT